MEPTATQETGDSSDSTKKESKRDRGTRDRFMVPAGRWELSVSKSGVGGGGHTFIDEAPRTPEASQDADWRKTSPNPLFGKVAREETL